MLPFNKIFKYQPLCDKTLIFFGAAMGIIGGGAAPLMALIFGDLIEIFDPNKTDAQVAEAYKTLAIWIGIISAVLWIAGYF